MLRWCSILLALGLCVPFAQAAAQTIDIFMGTDVEGFDGEAPSSFSFGIEVLGPGITDVTVTPPGLSPIALTPDADEFSTGESFASLAALQAAFPASGTYEFVFNGGAFSVSLDYLEVPEPTCFADVVSPEHGGTAPANPTFSWVVDPCASSLFIDLEGLPEGEEILSGSFPAADASVMLEDIPDAPGSLPPGDYEFDVEPLNFVSEVVDTETHTYFHANAFGHSTLARFTVVEPVPSASRLWLAALAALLVGAPLLSRRLARPARGSPLDGV